MRVVIDLKECNGYGSCVLAAPDVFRLDESGDFAELIEASPREEQRPQIVDAVRVCPKRAISIID